MVTSADIVRAPTSTNIYLSSLISDQAFRAGYTISYGFENRAQWESFGATTAFNSATASWASVANLNFREITNYTSAQRSTTTWVESLVSLTGNDATTLGQHFLPGTGDLGGEFNYTHPTFTAANLARGGYAFLTLLHEIGHGLGLEHPHPDSGTVPTKFPGVVNSEDLGDFGLNQGVWTVMSYNDGLQEIGLSPSRAYGWQLTPMALDIAAIQRIYGANTTTGTGANSYALPTANVAGTGYSAIWDVNGTDTITAGTTGGDAVLDLRAATLVVGPGAGGWLSRVAGVYGGVTIANNVVVENATGSNGNDRLTGNDANNQLDGGAGLDSVSYASATSALSINLTAGTASGTGVGSDTLVSIENARGGTGADTLTAVENAVASAGGDFFKPQFLVTNSIALAMSLDSGFSLSADDHITSATTVPHASVQISASGQFEYFSFTVSGANQSVTIDIDATYGIDTVVRIYRADGTEVQNNDDGASIDAGSTASLDSLLTASLSDGTYYVRVGSYGQAGDTPLAAGANLVLNVSVAGHVVAGAGLTKGSVLEGGGGDDFLTSGNGSDILSGDDGNDTVYYARAGGSVVVDLSTGVVSGAGGADRLISIENVHGSASADTLTGSSENNRLDGGGGADRLIGGAGDDTYVVDVEADVIVEDVNGGVDTVLAMDNFYLYANVERLTQGATGNIYGVGNDLANLITGGVGANLLLGGAGDDIVNGGAGNDLLFGEAGVDTLNGDAGIDYIAGGAGNDIINGLADADNLHGEAGDDVLDGGAGFVTDLITGGDGNDIIRAASGLGDYDILNGAGGDDTYYVDTPDDIIYEGAGEGIDTVYANINGAGYYLWAQVDNLVLEGNTPFGVGNALNNTLTGSAAGNYLLGDAGDDILNGKGGNDVLFGQAGADTFIFERGTGGDVIGDFARGQDRIDLRAFGLTFAQVQAGFSQAGGNGAIALGAGDFIVLQNVTMSQLTAADFIL